jgi:hypothetical protein
MKQFKKITYLGQKAEITNMETDIFDRTWFNIAFYNRDNGSRTKVCHVLSTCDSIKYI